MMIAFKPGAAYLARPPILNLDKTQVLVPNVPMYWVCPIHVLTNGFQREFVADVLVDYDLGEVTVKSRALRICTLLNWAVDTMEQGNLLTIVEALAPREIGKLINVY